MSDTKISALTSGGAAQATDLIPEARAGANVAVTAQSIANLAPNPSNPFLVQQLTLTASQLYADDGTYVTIVPAVSGKRIFVFSAIGVLGATGTGYTTLQVIWTINGATYATDNWDATYLAFVHSGFGIANVTTAHDMTNQPLQLKIQGTKSLTPTASISWTVFYALV